ncbi:MAG: sodium:solute symporter [Ignavibacteria bacterium]|nr:sodium:solute symporter [Ignavibacteria bacterium]
MIDSHLITYGIIILYLGGIALFGVVAGGKQKTVQEYFLGTGHIPWWAVCFSIVSAETSTLTFISVPGVAYLTNCSFFQVVIGYFIGRMIVAGYFLPRYFKGEMATAYTFLENRFGKKTRSFASIVFLVTRIAADGVRLFAAAIPLKLLLGISYPPAILIIASVTLIFTYMGGVRGVIWVEALQMTIYLGAAALSVYLLVNLIPGGLQGIINFPQLQSKIQCIDLGFSNGPGAFFAKPYTLLGGIIGGMFLSMASHGTDQIIVQRLLATKTLQNARKALIGNALIIIFQFALFLCIGVLLFMYYGVRPVKSDEIFPLFIIEKLPAIASGIVIAGLLSAALSTLAGSVSALASSFMLDLYLPFSRRQLSEEQKLSISRRVTIIWTVLLTFSAFFFMSSSKAVVEIALSIASFTYGGLLGTFLIGLFSGKIRERDVLAGFIAAILVMIQVITSHIVGWTWYTLIGVIVTMVVAFFVNRVSGQN